MSSNAGMPQHHQAQQASTYAQRPPAHSASNIDYGQYGYSAIILITMIPRSMGILRHILTLMRFVLAPASAPAPAPAPAARRARLGMKKTTSHLLLQLLWSRHLVESVDDNDDHQS